MLLHRPQTLALVATLAAHVYASAALTSDADAMRELTAIRTLMAAGEPAQAIPRIVQVHRYLASKASPPNCAPPKHSTGALNQPKAAETIMQSAQDALASKDYGVACQSAMLLGIAVEKDLQQLPPAARLSQQERAWMQAGAPQDLGSLDQLMWANLDAGQLTKVEELAASILERTAKLPAMQQPDFFQHSARTALGLVRLQSGATAASVAGYLKHSLEVTPGVMLLSSKPSVRLAAALWEKGETAAVIAYLEQAATMNWQSATQTIRKWLEQAKSGVEPSFQ